MSRSYKKAPVTGATRAESEKQDKRIASGKLRSAYRQALVHGEDLPDWRCTGHGSWCFAKDGKRWLDVKKCSPETVRKVKGK